MAAAALAAAPVAASAAPLSGPAAPNIVAPLAPNLASLPAATCTETSPGQRSCDLWAKLGATDLPGAANVPVWGFVSSNADTPATPGGPNLIVNQGDVVSITLHNALPAGVNGGNEALSLGLPSAPLLPDTSGVVQGGQRTYTFTAARPGTFVYEAGPTQNARQQVAMGLAGALIVRPPGLATATLTTALGANADLTYTATSAGAGGNDISVEYADPGAPNAPLAVSVAGDAITVSLATDGSGAITSTAADVQTAVAASPAAAALVGVAPASGSDGTGVVAPLGPANLAGGQSSAYGAGSAFDDEAVLVLSELDPALNTSADPSSFDMKGFRPTYRLINGRTYHDGGSIPSTAMVDVLPDDDVLLRYVNAGLDEHSMGLLGMHQTVLATDGNPTTYTYQAVAETVGAGATMDTLVHVPTSASGQQFALMDEGQHLDLAGAGWATNAQSPVTAGGMLTFIRAAAAADGCAGPVPTAGSATPDVTDSTTPVAVSATFSACTPSGGGPKNVDGVEYFIDSVAADGSGTAVPVGSPAGTVASAFSIDPSTLAPGTHTVYVHAHDDGGMWGAYDAETLFVDAIGPDSTGLLLTPAAANGSADVAVSGTGDDSANGGANVTDAELRIDSQAAPPVAMTVTAPTGSVSEITGTIPAATVNGLADGAHTVYVRSRDALGNWGAFSPVTLTVDKTAPTGSAASFGPSPNNGTISIDPNTSELQVEATFTDPVSGGVNSGIGRAEGFLDAPGANGSGVVFVATDGAFGGPAETAYSRFALGQVNALAQGPHVFYAHAQDAAGNWGPFVTATLVVDKTGPNVGGLGAVSNVLSGTATDPVVPGTGSGSNIVAAEWFEGSDPGAGAGNPMTASDGTFNSPTEGIRATLTGLVIGSHTLSVRAQDAAGSWGPATNVTVTIVPRLIFADGFASGNLNAWSLRVGGSSIAASTAAKLHGADAYGMQVTQANGTARYVQDTSPANELEYSARFYFNPHGALTGTQTPTILAGRTAAGQVALQVQYQRVNATTYRVRAGALATGGVRNTNWFTITNAAHAIEVDWRAVPTGGFLRLYTDGTLRQTLNAIPNDAYRIDSVRLGPSATLGAGLSGVLYFDDFVSQSGGTVGP